MLARTSLAQRDLASTHVSDLPRREEEKDWRADARITFKTGVVVQNPAVLVDSILEIVAVKVGDRDPAVIPASELSAFPKTIHADLETRVDPQELERENSGVTRAYHSHPRRRWIQGQIVELRLVEDVV